jgi:hypothetical protein
MHVFDVILSDRLPGLRQFFHEGGGREVVAYFGFVTLALRYPFARFHGGNFRQGEKVAFDLCEIVGGIQKRQLA